MLRLFRNVCKVAKLHVGKVRCTNGEVLQTLHFEIEKPQQPVWKYDSLVMACGSKKHVKLMILHCGSFRSPDGQTNQKHKHATPVIISVASKDTLRMKVLLEVSLWLVL